MIDENIKHEIESSEKEKKIRELMKTITNLKSETSFNEEIAEKREVQLIQDDFGFEGVKF